MSEDFIVSARKYRPTTFNTVVGQDHIVQTLMKAIASNHLAQAYLFTGPRGIGKTTCARILAKAINCENQEKDGNPCNKCNSCLTFNDQRSLNIYELDAASNNSVEDIRALVDQVRFPPQSGKYKVYIIDEVHMLSQSAFNAFLKTLEEPPSYAIFILATTEKHKIIPTILSRCQIFDFNRIRIKDMIEHLQFISEKENIKSEEEALHIIAQKADGALRDALTIFDRIVSYTGDKISYDFVIDNLNIIDYEYFFKATDYIINKDVSQTLLIFDEIINKGFDGQNFLIGLSEHFRNLLVSKTPGTIKLLEIPESSKNKYSAQSAKADLSFILSSLNILNQFNINYKESKNQRLHTELALIKLCYIQDAISLSDQMKDQKKKPSIVEKEESKPISNNHKAIRKKNGIKSNGSKKFIGDLSKIRSEIQIEEDIKNNNGSNSKPENLVNQEYTRVDQTKFLIAWQDYIDQELKGKKINLYKSLTQNEPVFPDDHTVQILVENYALEELFQNEKTRLVDYLINKHDIQNIKIECVVSTPSKEDQTKFIINPKDKFMRMKEINPELGNLQKKLGLQPEL